MTKSGKRGESGEGRLGCFLWLLLVGIGALIAWKAIPVKIATAELYDFMEEQAKWAYGASPEQIRGRIIEKAKELDLPVDPRYVTVARNGDNIKMECAFVVPLEFPGYTYDWEFDLQINRAIFIF
jgi:hypothetical protein